LAVMSSIPRSVSLCWLSSPCSMCTNHAASHVRATQ
jgi:hypothetical protein